MKFETIKELYEAVKAGKVKENELTIVLDNDCTSYHEGPFEDPDGKELDNGHYVKEANGYHDIESLYKLLFPKAKVEWC